MARFVTYQKVGCPVVAKKLGLSNCPRNYPIMCALKECMNDYCCKKTVHNCEVHGGVRICPSTIKPTAAPRFNRLKPKDMNQRRTHGGTPHTNHTAEGSPASSSSKPDTFTLALLIICLCVVSLLLYLWTRDDPKDEYSRRNSSRGWRNGRWTTPLLQTVSVGGEDDTLGRRDRPMIQIENMTYIETEDLELSAGSDHDRTLEPFMSFSHSPKQPSLISNGASIDPQMLYGDGRKYRSSMPSRPLDESMEKDDDQTSHASLLNEGRV